MPTTSADVDGSRSHGERVAAAVLKAAAKATMTKIDIAKMAVRG
jgi:hypothetical protein